MLLCLYLHLALDIAASEVFEVLPWLPELSLLRAAETERARERHYVSQ